jgi:prepilin-type N-terminal cleavage/methylation domain-containing protein
VFRDHVRKYLAPSIPGFSLIEISMVLLIIGIIVAGMMKGKDLVDAAKMSSTANDIQVLMIAFDRYVVQHEAPPGDDSGAAARFGGVANGNGDGQISGDDTKNVFAHLHAAGLIESVNFKTPKIGGQYDIISEDNVAKLRISKKGEAFITKKQLSVLRAKTEELLGKEKGHLESDPDTVEDKQKCIVKIALQ